MGTCRRYFAVLKPRSLCYIGGRGSGPTGTLLRLRPPGPCAMTTLRYSAFTAVAAAMLAVASAFVAEPARAQTKWILPSAYPADNFHSENLAAFAKDMADVTGGKLTITPYPNASLFPATAIKSAVRIGQAQMGEVLLSLHDNEDPMLGIDVVPFLA